MTDERPFGQPALVSDQAPAGLDPSGFDQAQEEAERIASEAAACIDAKLFEPMIRQAAETLYESLMDTVQDYLIDNARWNIRERLQTADRQVRHQFNRVVQIEDRLRRVDNGICEIASRHKAETVADRSTNIVPVPEWMLRNWLDIIRARDTQESAA